MKNVLHVMNYSASYRGNFIESLESLDKELAKSGSKNVYLFCAEAATKDSSIWIEEMKKNGAIVEFLTSSREENIKLIRRLIKEYEVALVHTHFVTFSEFMEVRSAIAQNVPMIMHMHNHSVKSNVIKNYIRRIVYRRCIFLACSESVYESVKRDFPRNEKYEIDNGVNFDRLDNYSPVSEAEYNVSADATKFLIFGFDFYRKGVDLAIKAIRDLREEGGNYCLLVSLSTNFDQVKEEIVKILGEIPDWIKIIKARNDVATLYNYVDIFLSPSREEGLPYSVIEAAYSNCSVVLSNISAQNNLKIKYGYWFESENVDSFKDKIKEALSERASKHDNIASVHEYMKENYALSRWSESVVALYKDIWAKRGIV